MIAKPERPIWQYNMLIGIVAALLFIPLLGGVHLFDWDEINFAESAREMIKSGDYLTVQINFIPFWEKPPLFIWMQVLSMKMFGINEFAARLPNAICGIVSLLLLFNIGRKQLDVRFGLWWVLLYGGSVLPFFYFKSGIIDPWFNLFIFLSIYQFYLYLSRPDRKMMHAAGSSFFIGLAILTKGPVALLVFLMAAGLFMLIKKFRVRIRLPEVIVFALVLAFTGGFWFLLQILKGNYSIITDFIAYQIRLFRTKDAGHGGFLLYHFVVLFAGVFPASVFALPALFTSKNSGKSGNDFYLWMRILFWVVLILFTIVKTKIVHYSSLCYFPLTFIAAWSVYHATSFTPFWKAVSRVLIVALGLILAVVVSGLTLIDYFKHFIISRNWIDDPFAIACLSANGEWKGYEIITSVVLIIGILGFMVKWKKDNYEQAIRILTVTMAVFMFMAMLLIVPRVEAYSQRAAIEFFSSVSDQDAYLETLGYKSYAHLFYGQVKNNSRDITHDKNWLLTGDIDKPAYFSIKVNRKEKFVQEHPDLTLLYEKNGFVFFKRTPNLNK
jgi:4-amino-4-deoxy-L-arabinose transferase-like glycosyltransferase